MSTTEEYYATIQLLEILLIHFSLKTLSNVASNLEMPTEYLQHGKAFCQLLL